MHAAHRWENQPAIRLGLEDLDHAEITRTIDEAIRRERMEGPGAREPKALLVGLGLIQDDQLLNAAVVLFGRTDRLLPSYIQCVLRMARFRGRDKTEFIDNRQEIGNAFALFQRAQRFMRDHLPVAGRIVPGIFERIDEPLYPTAALREALANALCHRDYSIGGGAVSVAIYDDRLEISSTGVLPFDLTPADLIRPHRSRPWNPLIAQAFYRRGLIETWGRGTIKMAELTTGAGLPPPEFECSVGEVLVRFRPTHSAPLVPGDYELSPLQQELLRALAAIGPASLAQLRATIRVHAADRTIRENLAILRDVGVADSLGQGRGARWKLKGPSR